MRQKPKHRIIAALMALAVTITAGVPAGTTVKADTTATNTTFSTARELPFNTSIAEETSDSDNKRYYTFTLDEASELNLKAIITLHNQRGFYIYIYDATKTQFYSYTATIDPHYDFSTDSIYLTGGTYYLMLEFSGTFSFTATIDSLGESFTETQDDNNDTLEDASSIELKTKYKGVLAVNENIDYYQFSIPAAGTLTFNLTNATDNTLKYVFYDADGYSGYLNTVSKGNNTSQEITSFPKGTYYLAIMKNDTNADGGSYTFSVSFLKTKPAAPTISSVVNSASKKMTVTWSEVSDADGYELQYSTKKNFKSNVVKKTISDSETSAKYSKLKKGKTYYVRMRSYIESDGEKTYSSWSSKVSVKIQK